MAVHLSKRVVFKSTQFHLEINSPHTFHKHQFFLALSLITFLIFALFLVRANQSLLASQINAQDPSSELGLIRINDQFEKFDPGNIQIKEPQIPPEKLKKPDPRLEVLKKYLSQFNSPLKEHAQDFLDAADNYNVDWRLVPSIAGVESTFGKRIPGGHDPLLTSYNGWGWGVYGDKIIKFKSWREAIFSVTKGIKKGYIDKGLTDPLSMNTKYASSPYWAGSLSYFLNDLDYFADTNKPPLTTPEEIQNLVFQQFSYLKLEGDHFSLQLSEE